MCTFGFLGAFANERRRLEARLDCFFLAGQRRMFVPHDLSPAIARQEGAIAERRFDGKDAPLCHRVPFFDMQIPRIGSALCFVA
jgi:hypothetical protein